MEGADDRAGALGFGLGVEPPAPRRQFNRTLDLAKLQAAADAIVADDPDGAGSARDPAAELLPEGTSLGAARPKAVVQADKKLWIAKYVSTEACWNPPRAAPALILLAGER